MDDQRVPLCWQEIRANHDANGNPRHVVLVYCTAGGVMLGAEVGYNSPRRVVAELLGDASADVTIPELTAGSTDGWRDTLSMAEAHDPRAPWHVVWDDGEHLRYFWSEGAAKRHAGRYNKIMGKSGRQRAESTAPRSAPRETS